MWYPGQGTRRASTTHTVAILTRMGHEGSPQVYSGMNITLRLLSLRRAVHTIVQTLCVKTPPTTQRKHSQTGRKGSETS